MKRKQGRIRVWIAYSLTRTCCLACLFGLVILGLAGCASTHQNKEDAIPIDLFQLLIEMGYQPNRGLAGIYEPGNLIQTKEPGAQGKPVAFSTPIVFKWRKDCFPDQNPHVSPFVVPDTVGRTSDAFSLDASLVRLFLPMLKFDRSSVSDYRIELGKARIHTLAKGDLSHNFSPNCVKALSRAMADDDRIEWFSVIVEAVVVDSLTIEMKWQSGTDAAFRLGILDTLKQQLAGIFTGQDRSGLGLLTNNSHQSVLQAKQSVIIGYRMRPIQPVMREK